MLVAQIKNGKVVNVAHLAAGQDAPLGWVEATDTAMIGATFDGLTFKIPRMPVEEVSLELQRLQMSCSQMQGILTLGEAEWGKVLAYRDGATWAEKVVIDSAADWVRTSQNISFFGHLLGYTDEQMDTLFLQAAQVNA